MSTTPRPVVVDLGKHKNKDVKVLVRGEGPLLEEIDAVVTNLVAAGTVPAGVQPPIIVVGPEAKKAKTGWMIGGR